MKLRTHIAIVALVGVFGTSLLAQEGARFVSANKLTVRSCPSTSCGQVSWLLKGQKVSVYETRSGWARISKFYNAACLNGVSQFIDSGNKKCSAENGIDDGKMARWVSEDFLAVSREEKAAKTSSPLHAAVSKSDGYSQYEDVFISSTEQLVRDGKCSIEDIVENGGWTKATGSNADRPVYFIYCGGFTVSNRLYLDASTGDVFK